MSEAAQAPAPARQPVRRWVGIALAAIGLMFVFAGMAQVQSAQAAYELGAFGRALTTSDCTLDGFGDKFGYDTTDSSIKGSGGSCTDKDALALRASLQQAQGMQGVGVVALITGVVVAVWPRRLPAS